MAKQKLEADFAMTLRPIEAANLDQIEDYWWWTGWKYRLWPANVDWTDRLVYGFDMKKRHLVVLLRITRFAAFDYHTRSQFREQVHKGCGMYPDLDGERHGQNMPFASGGKVLTGFAVRWEHVRNVDIPFPIKRFPQFGWLNLTGISDEAVAIDAADLHDEFGYRMQQLRRYERNPRLLQAARRYWRKKMRGRLQCWACGFDFGKFYGADLGDGFIEMHHEEWLSRSRKRRPKTVTDLVPVCSNCHRMIHRKPSLELDAEKLRKIVRSRR